MNILQSIATAMWNARGLGPTCPSEPPPVHSGRNHNLLSDNQIVEIENPYSNLCQSLKRRQVNFKLQQPLNKHMSSMINDTIEATVSTRIAYTMDSATMESFGKLLCHYS